jgi:hypothetical protein
LHVHVKLPAVFAHVAFALHPPLLVAHSFTSVQVTPSPVKPGLQAHVKDPRVFLQVPLALQLLVPAAHSSMSLQVKPSPV